MSLLEDELDQKIAELEESICQALDGLPADEEPLALRDLLLAQLKVCALHYRLMQLEADQKFLFSEADLSKIIGKYLEVVEFFRKIPKSDDKPSYEMRSMITLYRFVTHHFEEEGSEAGKQ